MKTTTPDLLALWATRRFAAATFYTFGLNNGSILRYTSYDVDLTFGGETYLAGGANGLLIERSASSNGQATTCTWKLGLEVSTLQFDIIPRQATINGVPFLEACKNGVFDGAVLTRQRAYMSLDDLTTVVGTITLDAGPIGEIDAGRSYATFNVSDYRELLNIQMPRTLYQTSCPNVLFGKNCGLNRASFLVSGTAGGGSTTSQIVASLSQATGYFDLGVITFTSGKNAGASRSVKAYVNGNPIKLQSPFSYAPVSGDAFAITPGCNKTLSTCVAKFHNQSNFRGAPYIPSADTAQ